MKHLFFILIIGLSTLSYGQTIDKEYFGYKHLQIIFKGDTVDILLKIRKGDEHKRKPIFLFCQGSLPIPLIKTIGEQTYQVLPFATDSIEIDYHLAIISKPYIPLIVDSKVLGPNSVYNDPKTNKIPQKYINRNYLDYYVNRNLKVIDFLQKMTIVDKSKLVVAGHSEGSTVAAKLATKSSKITHLIYASGNPFGRITSIIAQERVKEGQDTVEYAENMFEYWSYVVQNKSSLNDSYGDTPKTTYDFSIPSIQYLEKLSIPVLICYGTKDYSAPFNDYLRIETTRQNKKNFTFKSYLGLEHNFFPLSENGRPDYNQFNWDKIANHWWQWTMK